MAVLKKISILLFITGVASFVQAQDDKPPFENLSIDRPDVSNLPVTVRPGHYQFEVGFEYSKNHHSKSYNIPNFLLRTGIGKRTEIRIGTSLTQLDSLNAELSGNVSSGTLSLKHRFLDEKKWWPSIGIQPSINLVNTRWDEQSPAANNVTYDLILLFNDNFHEKIYLNYNVGWFWLSAAEQRWLFSASLSFQHTHRLGYFLEAYSFRTWSEHKNISYDAGITFLVNPRFQLDVYVGKLWTYSSNFQYVGTGVGFRLDKGDMKHRTFKEIGIHH